MDQPVTSDSNYDPRILLQIFGFKITKAVVSIIVFVIGGIPLLIYPVVLGANLMQLAAFGTPNNASPWLSMLVLLFIGITTAYPVTYIVCVENYRRNSKRAEIIYTAFIPLLHLAISVGLGYLWGIMST